MRHPTSEVQSFYIGAGTRIWQYCVILKDAVIGVDCNINAFVFIENKVKIGDRVTVKSGVQLWDGIEIGNDVFIGPNATFSNDRRPRSGHHLKEIPLTSIGNGSSIGANATILPGIRIGTYAMIGAGSVVTRDVPDRALVFGVPARFVKWLNSDGSDMSIADGYFVDNEGFRWQEKNGILIKL